MQRVVSLVAACVLASAAPAADKKPPAGGKMDLEAVFKRLDADADGKLTKDEFSKLAERVRAKTGKGNGQFADKLFEKLDADSDGTLSLAEFKNLAELRKGRANAKDK